MKFTNVIYPLLVVLLAVFAVAPLEYPGAFQSHTGLLAYYNLIDLDQHLALAWAPIIGKTFDVFRSDGALPYWIAELGHVIGFSYLTSVKLVYGLAWIASGLAMFALARRFFDETSALLAAMVYVYLPFHIATVYVRGAFAESVAWAVMPGACAVVMPPTPTHRRLHFTLGILLFALLFLIQPGIALLFALFTCAVAAALNWRTGSWKHWLRGSLSAGGGLGVGALLYVPTILRYGANISRDGFTANFVHPFQLFSALWGFGISTGSYLDQFPFQLGVVPLGLTLVAFALAQRSANQPLLRTIILFAGAAIVVVLFTFEIASPIWQLLGVLVTHPWQVLPFAGIALALTAGAVLELDERFTHPAMLAFFVALPVVAAYSYLAPRFLDANPTRPPIAIFNHNEIALWDYRIVGPLRHGATVRVYLTWQALRPVDYDYTIFLHAVHEDGKTYGANDAKPRDGALPTLQWTPGQVISDTQTIQIEVEGPREGYHLELGIYNAATGRRALTETGADALILPRPGDPAPLISEHLPPSKTQ